MQSALATLGRQTLSSRLTGTLQVAPMVVWVLDAYAMIWLLLHRLLGLHGLAGHAPLPTHYRLLFVLLAVPFVLLPLLTWWAAGLRRVATDGTNLLISGGSGPAAEVPLTEVLDIGEWRASDLRTIRVTFDRKTPAGRSVRFLAPTHFTVPRGEPHPVVLALRETVAAAQSEVERPRFGKRVGSAP
jgi:hypothetical protein